MVPICILSLLVLESKNKFVKKNYLGNKPLGRLRRRWKMIK
jgi:hypothetical protein